MVVFLPITLFIFFKSIFGIKDALSDNVFNEIFIPGAITPPLYVLLIITSKNYKKTITLELILKTRTDQLSDLLQIIKINILKL